MFSRVRYNLILLCCLALPVLAAPVTIIAVDEPPASFRNDVGTLDGYVIDLVRAMQTQLGNRDHIVMMPEQRALEMADTQPNVLLLGFTRTPEREQKYHMITPVLNKPWVLYGLKGRLMPFGHVEEARRLDSIGVVRGDVREKFLHQNGFDNLVAVARHGLNVRKLQSQRISALFFEPLGMAHECQRLAVDCQQFEELYRRRSNDVYLMMSRSGTSEATAKAWQDAAEQLRQQGIFEAIATQWAERIQQDYGIQSRYHEGRLEF